MMHEKIVTHFQSSNQSGYQKNVDCNYPCIGEQAKPHVLLCSPICFSASARRAKPARPGFQGLLWVCLVHTFKQIFLIVRPLTFQSRIVDQHGTRTLCAYSKHLGSLVIKSRSLLPLLLPCSIGSKTTYLRPPTLPGPSQKYAWGGAPTLPSPSQATLGHWKQIQTAHPISLVLSRSHPLVP